MYTLFGVWNIPIGVDFSKFLAAFGDKDEEQSSPQALSSLPKAV
jgi:hypothetical protein